MEPKPNKEIGTENGLRERNYKQQRMNTKNEIKTRANKTAKGMKNNPTIMENEYRIQTEINI